MFKVINAKTNRVLATCKTRYDAVMRIHEFYAEDHSHYNDFDSSYKIVEA